MKRLAIALGLAVLGLAGSPVVLPLGSAAAYVPTAEEIFAQLAMQAPAVSRAIFETRSVVLAPDLEAAARAAETRGGAEPELIEIPERGFRQRVYWIRDRLLAIETFSNDGEPLHVYLDEGMGAAGRALAADRHFETSDLLHPYIPFMGGSLADWRSGLAAWGIDPRRVSLVYSHKKGTLYRLGARDGPGAVFVPGRFALASLETQIVGAGGPVRLTIEFSGAIILGKSKKRDKLLHFPHTVTFLLEGEPFKLTKLTAFRADPPLNAFPLERLREQMPAVAAPLTLEEHGIR